MYKDWLTYGLCKKILALTLKIFYLDSTPARSHKPARALAAKRSYDNVKS